MSAFVPPGFRLDAFNCPRCGAYAQQRWLTNISGHFTSPDNRRHVAGVPGLTVSRCLRCQEDCLWLDERLAFPAASPAPLHAADMPADVRTLFAEARAVLPLSPRSACALLRQAISLTLEKASLPGATSTAKLEALLKSGAPELMRESLGAARVLGGSAVPPGQIDGADDSRTALALFGLANVLVYELITRPGKMEGIYREIAGKE